MRSVKYFLNIDPCYIISHTKFKKDKNLDIKIWDNKNTKRAIDKFYHNLRVRLFSDSKSRSHKAKDW